MAASEALERFDQAQTCVDVRQKCLDVDNTALILSAEVSHYVVVAWAPSTDGGWGCLMRNHTNQNMTPGKYRRLGTVQKTLQIGS